jgi:hypothetical protein
VTFVSCELRVLSETSPGDGPTSDQAYDGRLPRTFASLGYMDSCRSIIDLIGPCESSLETALEIVSCLGASHGVQVTDVDIRGCHDVRISLRVPIPASVLLEPPG